MAVISPVWVNESNLINKCLHYRSITTVLTNWCINIKTKIIKVLKSDPFENFNSGEPT